MSELTCNEFKPTKYSSHKRTLGNKMLWILNKGLVMDKDLSDDGTCMISFAHALITFHVISLCTARQKKPVTMTGTSWLPHW